MVYTNRPPKPLEIVTPGAIYRHYKTGKLYQVITVAIDGNKEAPEDPQVIYFEVTPPPGEAVPCYRRPIREWVELVLHDGAWVSRYAMHDPAEPQIFLGRSELMDALRESVACWNAITKQNPVRTDIFLTKALLKKLEAGGHA